MQLNSSNNMKNKRKNIIISSIIPIIIILVIGGIIGENWVKYNSSKQLETNNILNNTSNMQNITEENAMKENEVIESNRVEGNQIDNVYNKTSNNIADSNKEEKAEKNEKPSGNVKMNETVAFIGDSRTQGFIMYNGLKDVQDYSYIGLMVDTAVSKEFVKTSNGEKITLLQDMKNKNIKKVYIMLGVNELGWSYPSVFKLKYEELIDEIKKVKPSCEIYVQSIIPVTKSKDQSDKIYNNTNIKKFNSLIKEVANEKGVKYLDVQSALVNSQGYLPEDASPDGIHISPSYCKKWLNYIKSNS